MTPALNKTKQKQYGLLSMIAIITGTIIGAGIFVKNTELIETTNSALLSTIGWIIGGLIVASMLIAFIEVSSITKLKNEQGTFPAWSRYLWGEKMSKFISIYFTLIYFPMIIAIETSFAANQLIGIFNMEEMATFWLSTIIIYILVISAFLIVNNSQRTGKGIIASGTIIKVIPLLLIIIIALIILMGGTVGSTSDVNNIFDPKDKVINSGMDDGKNNILQILMILPAILFAFDGFLFVNSLSTETKKTSTYRNAAIIAIFITTMIFILFSLSSYMLAIPDSEGNLSSPQFNIGTIIGGIWAGFAGKIIGTLVELTIFVSIITVTFSYAVTTPWSIADLSNINEIADVNGTLLRRNKIGVPFRAGMRMLFLALIAITMVRTADGIYILTLNSIDNIELGAGKTLTDYNDSMTNYSSNIETMVNFTFYSIILIGAVRNRFTKRVEVEKSTGFFVFSFIAIFIMIFAVADLFFITIQGFGKSFSTLLGINSGHLTDDNIYNAFGFILWIIFFAFLIITVKCVEGKVKRLSKNDLKHKKYYQKAFNNHIPFNDYKINHKQPADIKYTRAQKINHKKTKKE